MSDKAGKGLSNTSLYQAWVNMRSRCYSSRAKGYSYYGGKGIRVCEEWKSSSMAFMAWAIENGYCRGLSLDRIDSDRDYSPDNCRWITISENSSHRTTDRDRKSVEERIKNKPTTKYYVGLGDVCVVNPESIGRDSVSVVEVAKLLGISYTLVHRLVYSGEWPSTVVNKKQRRVPKDFLIAKFGTTVEKLWPE